MEVDFTTKFDRPHSARQIGEAFCRLFKNGNPEFLAEVIKKIGGDEGPDKMFTEIGGPMTIKDWGVNAEGFVSAIQTLCLALKKDLDGN